jgi:hypothetical protein
LCHINLKRWMSAGLTILSMISFSFVLSILLCSIFFIKFVSLFLILFTSSLASISSIANISLILFFLI